MKEIRLATDNLMRGALVAAVLAALLALPSPAFALSDETEALLAETLETLEEATAAYEEASETADALEAEVDALEAEILETQALLEEAQEAASRAMVALYKEETVEGSFLTLLLNADGFGDLVLKLKYLDVINDGYQEALEEVSALMDELEEQEARLLVLQEQAEEEREEAYTALMAAQTARAEAEETAEDEEAAEELAAAMAAASSSSSSLATLDTSAVDWTMSEEEFIAEWTARIDAYLSGSPLAGYGSVFAEAAWYYGVDPRWSPAISCIESSKGKYCFKSHNAWGWGSVSWSSWEEAIWAHIKGLKSGYGTTVTEAAAKKYCPPTWQSWYTKVVNQMNSI